MSQPEDQPRREVLEVKRAAGEPRHREFTLWAPRREVRWDYARSVAGSGIAAGAEFISKPTERGGAAARGSAATHDAQGTCVRMDDAAGDAAQDANRENKATEPPPAASFTGNVDPSMI